MYSHESTMHYALHQSTQRSVGIQNWSMAMACMGGKWVCTSCTHRWWLWPMQKFCKS